MTIATSSRAELFCPIASVLQRFLDFKRAAGYAYRTEAQALRQLDRFLAGRLSATDPVITWDPSIESDSTSLPISRVGAAPDADSRAAFSRDQSNRLRTPRLHA